MQTDASEPGMSTGDEPGLSGNVRPKEPLFEAHTASFLFLSLAVISSRHRFLSPSWCLWGCFFIICFLPLFLSPPPSLSLSNLGCLRVVLRLDFVGLGVLEVSLPLWNKRRFGGTGGYKGVFEGEAAREDASDDATIAFAIESSFVEFIDKRRFWPKVAALSEGLWEEAETKESSEDTPSDSIFKTFVSESGSGLTRRCGVRISFLETCGSPGVYDSEFKQMDDSGIWGAGPSHRLAQKTNTWWRTNDEAL